MKKFMKKITIILVFMLVICLMAYSYLKIDILETVAISVGVTLYHFAMRLFVGYVINLIFHNDINYKRKWFQEKAFEPWLFKILRVKKWKKHMPTFEPEYFDIHKRDMKEIIGATCQAEVVHEIIMVLSFLPILLGKVFGATEIFVITSILAASIDLVFVIMQRFNRPRLVKLVRR